ncbi:MAG TPA: hypothetical protein VF163_00365 [Micromonosporaceae bacterium]
MAPPSDKREVRLLAVAVAAGPEAVLGASTATPGLDRAALFTLAREAVVELLLDEVSSME